MFKKMILVMLTIVAITLALPEKAEAAYPNGASVGVALTGGYPYSGIILTGGYPYSGLILTGKFDSVPMVFGASFNFGSGYFGDVIAGLGVTADWWGLKLPLGQAGDAAVSMYLGPGATLDLVFGTIGNGYFGADIGIRMPIGFSFLVKKTWEIFIEPSIGLGILGIDVSGGSTTVRLLGFGLSSEGGFYLPIRGGGQFGFRYWF